ncbi:Peptidase A4 family protein [uncultured archaeon]|nr:Peptidase A4 family protein [uncultured archaeon]
MKITKRKAMLFTVVLLIPTVMAVTVFANESQFIANSGSGIDNSYNWAGYVASGGTYTSISGSWIIPQINSPIANTADTSWIGIGGVTNGDLIQTGTQAIVNAAGKVSYQAWYELLPRGSVPISVSVNPGDSITASITQQQNNQWSILLRDNTNGQSFQKTVTYSSSLSSAEWIEEMLSAGRGRGFIPLDNFGIVQFSNASTIKNGNTINIAPAGAEKMTMANGWQDLATPSAIGSDGSTFAVTRTNVTSTPSIRHPFGRRGWQRTGIGIRGIVPSRWNNYFRVGQGSGVRSNYITYSDLTGRG